MDKIFNLKIDTKNKNISTVTGLKQFDNNSVLNITLLQNSLAVDLSDCTVRINFLREDERVLLYMADIVSAKEGNVAIKLSPEVLEKVGTVQADISVFDSNLLKITSATFNLKVDKSIYSNDYYLDMKDFDIVQRMHIEEENRIKNEKTRIEAESNRITDEKKRSDAEALRNEKETERISNEEKRVQAENKRNEDEHTRSEAENKRNECESNRIDQEKIRVENEKARSKSEDQRKIADNTMAENELARITYEQQRQANEKARTEKETKRITDEKLRTEAEEKRVQNEKFRVEKEAERINSENTRVTAEQKRETNETNRVEAEKTRVKEWDKIKDNFKEVNSIDWGNVKNKPDFSEIGKVKSVNSKTGEVVLKAEDINFNDNSSVEEFKKNSISKHTELDKRISDITNNISIGDVKARKEIIDIKRMLKEQKAMDFINRTGIGFYDTFDTNTNITENNLATRMEDHSYLFKGRLNSIRFKPQTFDNINKIDLNLYTKLNNYVISKNKISNSNTVLLDNYTRNISKKDSLFVDGKENKILNVDRVKQNSSDFNNVKITTDDYDISNMNARKIVITDDGYIVVALKDTKLKQIHLYVSDDNGSSFKSMHDTFWFDGSGGDFSIISQGKYVYVLYNYDKTKLCCAVIEVPSGYGYISNYVVYDKLYSPTESISVCFSQSKKSIFVCFTSKTEEYKNSYNVYLAQLSLGELHNIALARKVEVITKYNNGDVNFSQGIVIDGEYPVIIAKCHGYGTDKIAVFSSKNIGAAYITDTTWHGNEIKNASGVLSNDALDTISGIYIPPKVSNNDNGTVCVIHASENLNLYFSTDYGETWQVKKFSTIFDRCYDASLTANSNGDLFIAYGNIIDSINQVFLIKYNIKNDIIDYRKQISNQRENCGSYPTMYYDELCSKEFNYPYVLYKQYDGIMLSCPQVKNDILTLTLEQPVSLLEQEKVYLVAFEVKQSGEKMKIKSIDSNTCNFVLDNLNTNTVDLEITSENARLYSIAYAIS